MFALRDRHQVLESIRSLRLCFYPYLYEFALYCNLYAFTSSRYMSVKLSRTDIRHTFLDVLLYAQNLSAIARF